MTFQTQKANVIVMEYIGYGIYPGDTTADRILEDSIIVYDFLTKEMKIPEKNIILFGRSIGTGPATWLAAQRK